MVEEKTHIAHVGAGFLALDERILHAYERFLKNAEKTQRELEIVLLENRDVKDTLRDICLNKEANFVEISGVRISALGEGKFLRCGLGYGLDGFFLFKGNYFNWFRNYFDRDTIQKVKSDCFVEEIQKETNPYPNVEVFLKTINWGTLCLAKTRKLASNPLAVTKRLEILDRFHA